MSKLILIPILILCAACAGSGGGGRSQDSTVSGLDKSGTYNIEQVMCYNSALTVNTNNSTYAAPYSEQVVITGNTYTATMSDADCITNVSGTLVFRTDNTMDIASGSVTSASGGSCTLNPILTNSSAISNASASTYTTGASIPSATNVVYVHNTTTGRIGLLSSHSDGQGGYCFIVYRKQ